MFEKTSGKPSTVFKVISVILFRYKHQHANANMLVGLFSRYTIFSPKDDQPCMDHDRSTGEVRY